MPSDPVRMRRFAFAKRSAIDVPEQIHAHERLGRDAGRIESEHRLMLANQVLSVADHCDVEELRVAGRLKGRPVVEHATSVGLDVRSADSCHGCIIVARSPQPVSTAVYALLVAANFSRLNTAMSCAQLYLRFTGRRSTDADPCAFRAYGLSRPHLESIHDSPIHAGESRHCDRVLRCDWRLGDGVRKCGVQHPSGCFGARGAATVLR